MQLLGILAISSLALAACALGAAPQPATGCPPASLHDTSRVRGLLRAPAQEILVQFGLDSARAEEVTPLADPSDAAVCGQLRAALERQRPGEISDSARIAFFRSGPLYFVTTAPLRRPFPLVVDEGDARMYVVGRDMRMRFSTMV